MIPASPLTLIERAINTRYEQQRRTRLIGTIAPAFMGISLFALSFVTIFFAIFNTSPGHWLALAILDSLLLLVAGLLYLGLVAARHGRINIAAILVAGTSGLGAASIQIFWDYTQGFDTFSLVEFTTFAVVIVLAGVMGNGWLILASTAFMGVVSTVILIAAPRAPGIDPFITRNFFIIAPSIVMYQWIFAAIMFTVWLSFQRSLGELGVAYERARQLDELKDQFISSVNHELRTPTMTLNTLLETAMLASDRMNKEQLHQVFTRAYRASTNLAELIKSILSARRIEDEVAHLQPAVVLIKDALATAAEQIDPRDGGLVQRDLRMNIPSSLIAWCDRIKLQQVLTNLLSNAVKYSAPGTPIEVTAELTTETMNTPARWGRSTSISQPMIAIMVRDYGQGVPPDQNALLFNKFTRLPRDLASRIMGNGLGLYLCRIYAEAMGGRIWVESTGVEGEGSSFHLRLPAPTVSQIAASSHPDLGQFEGSVADPT